MESKEMTTPKSIMANPYGLISFGGQVKFDNVQANERGRKIVPAGTPVGAETNFLTNDKTVLGLANDENVQGLLLHDVDVTNGQTNATILTGGTVNLKFIDKSVTLSDAVKKGLNKITFINR